MGLVSVGLQISSALAAFHQASDSQLSMGSLGQLSHWVERAMGMTSGEQMDSMADESQERLITSWCLILVSTGQPVSFE